jgi:hypothetical protein
MSRWDAAIVARHEVAGRMPPQKSRPVGHGVFVQVCVRPDTMVGVTKFEMRKLKRIYVI